jgi:hypothetical protein
MQKLMDDLQEALGQLKRAKPGVNRALDRWAFEPHKPELRKELQQSLCGLLDRESACYERLERAVLELAGRLQKLEERVAGDGA